MSGLELIVGVILGGIPVVLEAYDRYWAISRTFTTFRQFSKELLILDATLDTQKALFRSNVARLLRAMLKDPGKANALLSSTNSWTADDFAIPHNSTKASGLEDSFRTWKRVLDQIRDTLQSICAEVEKFRAPTTENQNHKDSAMRHFEHIGNKFRLCFKKREVQEAIGNLRHFMNDFKSLTGQIIEDLGQIHSSIETVDQKRPRPTATDLNTLNDYRRIRTASSRLHETVSLHWSCAVHQRHAVCISFDGRDTERSVKFNVAIGSMDEGAAPLWLDIEYIDMIRQHSPPAIFSPGMIRSPAQDSNSAVLGIIKDLEEYAQPITSRGVSPLKKLVKRPKDTECTNVVKKTKVVRFQVPTADSNCIPLPEEAEEREFSSSKIPARNLDRVSDFCRHFQDRTSLCNPACVGYIRHSGLYRFYLPSTQNKTCPRNQTNLADVISRIAQDGISTLPRRAAVRVAGSLASAVLQYHATPWLPEIWQSSHVQYFGTEAITCHELIDMPRVSPYFEVKFTKSGKETESSQRLSLMSQSAATQDALGATIMRNPSLFCLGIVLLELGYCKPWPLLRGSILEKLEPKKRTEYHVAEKLAQSTFLADRMWPGYSDIVCKLLGCDFGLGKTDLRDERLQEAFLVDVVNALQKAEVRLAELGMRMNQL